MGFQQNGVNLGDALASLHWPVLIKYLDYEELGYISDASAWEVELGTNGSFLNAADVLIDASGASYLVEKNANLKVLMPTQNVIGINEVVTWVRAHASMQGHCCAAKLHPASMGEVFTILKSLED